MWSRSSRRSQRRSRRRPPRARTARLPTERPQRTAANARDDVPRRGLRTQFLDATEGDAVRQSVEAPRLEPAFVVLQIEAAAYRDAPPPLSERPTDADSLERMRREAKRTLARALARAVPRAALTAPDVFDVWERAGYHITPVHFYSSIPNTAELREPPPSTCPGVELNRDAQRQSLEALAPLFAEGARHWQDNTYFGLVDSLALYAMVRRHRPCTVVEIGSGHSTRMIEAALAENAEGTLVTIEPYPERMSSPPTFASEVQEVPLSLFESLSTNDILFIDSTHVLRFGSDVQ